MNDLILWRKATAEEQEIIDYCQKLLAEIDLEIVSIGAPKPPKP